MNESMGWTVGLGRWQGVRVRVHVLLVAFAVSVLWWGMSDRLGTKAYGPLCVAALAVSVLARETARLWVARRMGSEADEITLWPLGGWLAGSPPHDRRSELAVALAPPLASGVLMAVGAVVVAVIVPGVIASPTALSMSPLSLLPPSPVLLEGSIATLSVGASVVAAFATAAALLAWINGALLAINLLPVGALDAGHILRGVLRDDNDPQRQERLMARVAVATAVALGVLGWGVWDVQPGASLMLWFVALGMCRRERADAQSQKLTRRCLAGTPTPKGEARRCRTAAAHARRCRQQGQVCGRRVANGCFDLPRRHGAGRHAPPIADAPIVSTGEEPAKNGASTEGTNDSLPSDASSDQASSSDASSGEAQRRESGGITSVELARLYRAGIGRRRPRS